MKKILGLIFIGMSLILFGCGDSSVKTGDGPSNYAVSGIVEDENGVPIPGVTLSFGAFGVATTDAQGRWSKVGLSGSVLIQPAKDGWTFAPASITVNGARNGLKFVGEVNTPPVDAEVVIIEALVDANPAWAQINHDRVQLTLRNVGGPGYFKVQFWGKRPNVINPPLELFGETEVYEVGGGWSDTATWDVPTPGSSLTHTYIEEVVVLTRNHGQLTYRETSRAKPTLVDNL